MYNLLLEQSANAISIVDKMLNSIVETTESVIREGGFTGQRVILIFMPAIGNIAMTATNAEWGDSDDVVNNIKENMDKFPENFVGSVVIVRSPKDDNDSGRGLYLVSSFNAITEEVSNTALEYVEILWGIFRTTPILRHFFKDIIKIPNEIKSGFSVSLPEFDEIHSAIKEVLNARSN